MARRPLLAWTEEPDHRRGIHFAAHDDAWDHWSYATLAAHARRVAAGMTAAGVGRNGRVAVVLRSGPGFVATLFGTMLAGATPCPVAPPLLFQDRDRYDAHVRAVLATARPSLVVTGDDLVDHLTRLTPAAVATVDDLVARAGSGDAPDRPPAELALLQFTSGSSGTPRGVRVPFGALEANVAAIRRWLAMGPDDPTASWLPVHHDMGLIGCLVTPVVNGSDLWLLGPERFVRNPLRYLRCFGSAGARLSAMPGFGLDHVTRRVPPAALDGLDFGGWRALILGAERIDPAALARFAALLAPHGFRPSAFRPAYGLAEATLAVTGLPLGETYTSTPVDSAAVAVGACVTAAPGPPVVGCGPPLAGVHVHIVGEDGTTLPEGHVGEIVVTAPSVAAGYEDGGGTSTSTTAIADGTLHTGDAGFLHGGQLHVLGRLGDAMKVRGRALFAEDVEAALVETGLRRDRVAVLLGTTPAGVPTAVAAIEQADDAACAAAAAVLRRLAEGAVPVVLGLPRRTIPRTTSGKPRRRPLWRAYAEGRLAGAVAASAATPAT
jgi:acyl-CoA synthetase (AMP-forming)/AMP-acid ligase II